MDDISGNQSVDSDPIMASAGELAAQSTVCTEVVASSTCTGDASAFGFSAGMLVQEICPVSCNMCHLIWEHCVGTVLISTATYSSEITWSIDDGSPTTPSADNSVQSYTIELNTDTDHAFHYVDTFGDGWHGGYWEIKDKCGITMAGGENAGQVSEAGGTYIITGSAIRGSHPCPPAPPPPPPNPCRFPFDWNHFITL